MNHESLQVEAGLRQQPHVHRSDLHLPLQTVADGPRNARLEPGRPRADQKQPQQQQQGRQRQHRFGMKFHCTIRNVRRQRVSSKKWMTTCTRKPMRSLKSVRRYWSEGVLNDQ